MVNYFLGIEYSKERIKVALAKFDGKNYQVSALQNFEGDTTNTSLDKFAEWKKQTLGDAPVQAMLAITESMIFLKELKLPNTKREALNEAVYWELSGSSPLSPSQAIYEWLPIKIEDQEISIAAMAVRESQITALVDELTKSNIEVVSVEPGSIALSRAAGDAYDKNTMLLLVGDVETDIVVMKNGVPVFSTTSDVKLKREKSVKWKLNQTVSEQIAQNTDELITFWENRSGEKIGQVLITGDLVDKYFGLAASINKFANVPVNIARAKSLPLTFSNLTKASINRYFIAIGALARFLHNPYEGANIIPSDKKSKITDALNRNAKLMKLNKLNFIFGTYLTTLLSIAILLSVIWIYNNTQVNKMRESKETHPGQVLVEEIKNTNEYLAKIDALAKAHEDIGVKLLKISELTPLEVSLAKLNYDKYAIENNFVIEGTGTREAILAYYQKLSLESGAHEVVMPYSNLNEALENEFEIDISKFD